MGIGDWLLLLANALSVAGLAWVVVRLVRRRDAGFPGERRRAFVGK